MAKCNQLTPLPFKGLMIQTRTITADGKDLKTCPFTDVLLEVQHSLKDSFVTARHKAHSTEYFQCRNLRPGIICTQTLCYDVNTGRVGKHVRSTFLNATVITITIYSM